MTKKILLFSPPFSGHLNIFKSLVKEYGNHFDFTLVVAGWKNIKPNLDGIAIPVKIFAKSDLTETDPAIWTFPRVNDLLQECVDFVEEIEPDLVIYDFFSIEGYLVGKLLGIPYWCSIPALIGPFIYQDYLKAKLELPANVKSINAINSKFSGLLETSDVEMISDGVHLPGDVNLVWSFSSVTPVDFMLNRHSAPYKFIGHLDKINEKSLVGKRRPLIYFSFGTVVMDNIWNNDEAMRIRMKLFINKFAELTADKDFDVLFVGRGKVILDTCPLNWREVEFADQKSELAKADVFVTHAGGNSFHEAIFYKVPMIAVPFFGDQPLIASQIEKLGLGINCVEGGGIDTKESKAFLSEELAVKIANAVDEILQNRARYKSKFDELSLECDDVLGLLVSSQV